MSVDNKLAYAFLAWVLVSAISILLSRTGARNVTVYERRRE